MLEFKRGNLFEAEVEALVNTVNTIGVMGKGIALQFSKSFPEIIPAYKEACKSGELVIGKVQTIELPLLGGMEGPKYVINFPTKKHWRGDSKIEFIQSGLGSLREEIAERQIKSIAIPPLGCGLGGLNWSDVRREIEAVLSDMADVQIIVYEPTGKPEPAAMKNRTTKPKMTPGRAALLELMRRYLVPLMDDAVTLLELHKLMYFMQESGEELKLRFVKGRYGPYATNLRNVLNRIEGHFVTGFGDASEEPGKALEASEEATQKAQTFLKSKSETLSRFERVESLIDGFETPYGMELLASVHWVASHENDPATSTEEAVQLIHEWNERKRESFNNEHVQVAWDRLTSDGWL
ncbi:MAG: macro domain-containing protein [Planctomycetota bacterium]|nr:macro domain-containing protein [Planctomycetota bacterium]